MEQPPDPVPSPLSSITAHRVLIVGGGAIGGVVAARLADAGVPVTVLDISPALTERISRRRDSHHGTVLPDPGAGRRHRHRCRPADSARSGGTFGSWHPQGAPDVTVAENVYAGRRPVTPLGTVRWRAAACCTRRILDRIYRLAGTTMTLEGYSWPLRRGAAASYIARHQRPWPELTPMFRDHGIATFSIYTDGDRVFMHSEVSDASSWPSAWETELHQRWGKLVEPYIHVTDALARAVTPLTLVCHQSRARG